MSIRNGQHEGDICAWSGSPVAWLGCTRTSSAFGGALPRDCRSSSRSSRCVMALKILWWLIGGDWRKVPFNDQFRHSSKMAATAAILDLVSTLIFWPTPGSTASYFLWLIGGDWRKVPFDDQRQLVQFVLWLIGGHQSSPYSTSP
jgi:hypothetical protein